MGTKLIVLGRQEPHTSTYLLLKMINKNEQKKNDKNKQTTKIDLKIIFNKLSLIYVLFINLYNKIIKNKKIIHKFIFTNSMVYGTHRFNAAFTRALQ